MCYETGQCYLLLTVYLLTRAQKKLTGLSGAERNNIVDQLKQKLPF